MTLAFDLGIFPPEALSLCQWNMVKFSLQHVDKWLKPTSGKILETTVVIIIPRSVSVSRCPCIVTHLAKDCQGCHLSSKSVRLAR